MSRFVNLELGGDAEKRSQHTQLQIKDEAYYLSEARATFERGEFETALRHYGKVIEFNAANPSAWTGQVRMLIELGEFHEARLWADKALEHFPHEPELLAAKAVALGRNGDLQGALAFSDTSLQELGESAYVWLARADVLLARKEERAQHCFDKALALSAGDWVIAWLAGRIRCYYEQFALALKLLQQAVEWNAENFFLWLELGQCQQALGLVTGARQSFSAARQLNPRSSEAFLRAAELSHAGLGSRIRGWWRRYVS